MIISVEANTKKAEKSLGNVEKKLGKVVKKEKEVKKEGKAMGGGLESAMGPANALTGGLIAGFRGAVGGIKTAVVSMKTLKGAMISTGIGALIVAVGSLVLFFTKTRKGAEMLEVATAALGVIMGKLIDGASFLGGALVAMFQNPQKALMDFWELLKTNVINRFEGLFELIPAIGKSIGLLFKGKWAEAAEVAFNANAKIFTGVENLSGVLGDAAVMAGEMASEIISAVDAGALLAQQSIALREAQRELNVKFAEGRAQIREYQLVSEDTTKTIEERITASEKAGAIEAELLEERQRIAQEELRIHNENMALTESLEEDFDKQNELEVALIDLRTQSARIQKAILMKTQTLRKEEEANIAAHNKAILDAEEALQKKLDKMALKVADAILSTEKLELQKVARKYQTLMQGLKFHSEEFQILMKKQGVEEQAIRDKFDKLEVDSKRAVQKSKFDMAQQALGALIALNTAFASDDEEGAKRAFERNKRLSQASAILNTYQAVSDALAKDSIFPGSRFIAAAAAGAMGLAQVRGIGKTEFQSSTVSDSSLSGGLDNVLSGGGGGAAQSVSQAPPSIDFGFLGQGAGGGIQAYVIAENVSNGLQAEQKLQDQVVL